MSSPQRNLSVGSEHRASPAREQPASPSHRVGELQVVPIARPLDAAKSQGLYVPPQGRVCSPSLKAFVFGLSFRGKDGDVSVAPTAASVEEVAIISLGLPSCSV